MSGSTKLSDWLDNGTYLYPKVVDRNVSVPDDIYVSVGSSQDAKLVWETADADANCLIVSLPAGGATDVPVFVIGDDTLLNKDLGLFNGVTKPTIAVVSDDATKAIYLQHNATNGLIQTTSGGIDIIPVAGSYTRIGDAGVTSHVLATNDDLLVTGQLESNGDMFSDGRLYLSGNGMGIAASGYISFATTPDDTSSGFYNVTTGNPNLNLWLGTTLRRSLVIGDGVSRGGNYDHAAQNNPTIYLHSTQNPESDNRQFVKWYNDGSNSYHLTGIGGHRFGFESVIANGIITFTANPTTNLGVVFTVNTGTLTGTTGVPGANQFKIDSTLALTIASIVTNYNLIAGTGVTAHAYGNNVVFEASNAGTTANAYVTTETTDTDGVYSFNSLLTFTANPTTTSGIVFTVGTGTLTGVVGAPGANQFAIGSTLQDTITNLVNAYNTLATGVVAVNYGQSVQFVGGTSGISVFTETTDTDNVYSFVATTMRGGREFSAVFEMQPTALAIPSTGIATAGTTTYNSTTFTTRASGWDTDDSRARDASIRFYAVPSTGASVGVTAYWDFYRDGVLVNNSMQLTGGGTLQVNGAFYLTGLISGATTLSMAGDLTDYEATNGGNPSIFLGSAAAERFEVQSVYDAGAQTLDYVNFQTYAASATADKGKYVINVDGVEIFQIDDEGIVMSSKMIQGAQGTDIPSANDATLTLTGNYFDVTGSVQTNTLTATGVQAGTIITLQFDAAPLIKHATAGTGAQFQLAGAGDFQASAGDTLQLVYDGTYWRELSRTVI